mmetsp:Transcript_19130/g.48507  ORF Transcript_19130/g.48507 Transcript_19130/m.48507 type:complete len:372 (+) Transcript_19130:1004-2119(+)
MHHVRPLRGVQHKPIRKMHVRSADLKCPQLDSVQVNDVLRLPRQHVSRITVHRQRPGRPAIHKPSPLPESAAPLPLRPAPHVAHAVELRCGPQAVHPRAQRQNSWGMEKMTAAIGVGANHLEPVGIVLCQCPRGFRCLKAPELVDFRAGEDDCTLMQLGRLCRKMQQQRPPQGTPVAHPRHSAVSASRPPRLPVQPRRRTVLSIRRSGLEQLIDDILDRGRIQRARFGLGLQALRARRLGGDGLGEGSMPGHAESDPELGPPALLGLLSDMERRRRNPLTRRVSIIGGPMNMRFHIDHGDLGFQPLDVVKELNHIVVHTFLQVGQLFFHFLDRAVRMRAFLRQSHGNEVQGGKLTKRRVLPDCFEVPHTVQ